jgi:uncharacterized protein (DUF2132 family)
MSPMDNSHSKDNPQSKNPLHGWTLEAIITALQDHYGWEGMAHRVDIRCFTHDPSVKSSLKFLRKTPWAREKVEQLFLIMQGAKNPWGTGSNDA